MEIISFNLFALLVFLLFIILSQSSCKKSKSSDSRLGKLPPSPPKLPFIGHLHHLIGDMPHHSLTKLAQKFGPLMHLQLGQVPFIVVSSREMAKAVLKDHDPACANRPKSLGASIMFYNYQDIVFGPYGSYWRHMRKICVVELLSGKNSRLFNYIRQDEVLQLVKFIQSSCGVVINLTEKVRAVPSTVICRAAFGKTLTDRETMMICLKEGLDLAGGLDLSDLFPSVKLLHFVSWNRNKLLRMRRKLDAILDGIIQEHRDNLAATGKGNGELGGEDIVDVLLRIKEVGELEFPITDMNIKAILFDLFAGGADTTFTVVDWAMAELVRNPSVMSKVQTEIREAWKGKETIDANDVRQLNNLKMVIKETLRLHPPGPLMARACREEFKVDGYTIPLNAAVTINVGAIGRDPSYWHEPKIFRPERFENSSIDFLGNDYEFLPFGAGKRICPGINFGLAVVELLLAQLLYHFDWKLPDGMSISDVDMTEAPGLSVRRKNSLILVPTPYSPSVDG